MTKKNFFILSIKLFGLFSIISSLFSFLPSNVSFALMDIDLVAILWLVIVFAILIGLFIFLVFKSERVVRLLKLDQGFDNEVIELGNLNATDIIKLGTFIIGGFLILENIPAFLSHTYFALKTDVIGREYKVQDKFNWSFSGINLIIGFFLITNYEMVARLLKTDRKKG